MIRDIVLCTRCNNMCIIVDTVVDLSISWYNVTSPSLNIKYLILKVEEMCSMNDPPGSNNRGCGCMLCNRIMNDQRKATPDKKRESSIKSVINDHISHSQCIRRASLQGKFPASNHRKMLKCVSFKRSNMKASRLSYADSTGGSHWYLLAC